MLSGVMERMMSGAGVLNSSLSVMSKDIYLVGAFIFIVLSVTGYLLGISMYSVDSWTYYELSKTVFGDDFYRFNTYRSYFSEEYSASFPLGYPVILAIAHAIFGETPLTALGVNAAIATATWVLIIRLASKVGISPLSGLAIATSLVGCTFYLEETLSGRSIPAAIFFFVGAIYAWFSKRPFVSGLLLGFSVLIRFDYLVYALLFHLTIVVLSYKHIRSIAGMAMGFSLGLSPWIIYSIIHFDRLWVSDNSWIALSALPAYAVDFPAKASVTLLDNPAMWLDRITSNIAPLTLKVIDSAPRFPAFVLLSTFLLYILLSNKTVPRLKVLFFIFIIAASFVPYILTGYSDRRYFSLAFLCASGFMIFFIERTHLSNAARAAYNTILFAALLLSVALGGAYLTHKSWQGIQRLGEPDLALQQIELLQECHRKNPEVAYIFVGPVQSLAPPYGAVTGNRTAFIPSNFGRMTEHEKAAYFAHIKSFSFVSRPIDTNTCPSITSRN